MFLFSSLYFSLYYLGTSLIPATQNSKTLRMSINTYLKNQKILGKDKQNARLLASHQSNYLAEMQSSASTP